MLTGPFDFVVKPQGCPTAHALWQFATGALLNNSGEEGHIAQCAMCRQIVEKIRENKNSQEFLLSVFAHLIKISGVSVEILWRALLRQD